MSVAAPASRVASPYRGLTPYREADAERFFGRDAEREIIVSNLMARRLTLLYDESGVGKSSVLHAGVARRLRERARAERRERGAAKAVPVTVGRWRDDPLAAVSTAVAEQAGPLAPADATAAAPSPFLPLDAFLEGWTRRLGAKLLLILDQFEEHALYHARDRGERTLTHALPLVLGRQDVRVNVLIAIREDALAQLDQFKDDIPNLMQNRLRIPHLDRRAARQAIERPLAHHNDVHGTSATIEPALVTAVLEQVEAGKVVLSDSGTGAAAGSEDAEVRIESPYLQLVMERLWEEERAAGSDVLRLATLERLGGAERIVRTHLDGR